MMQLEQVVESLIGISDVVARQELPDDLLDRSRSYPHRIVFHVQSEQSTLEKAYTGLMVEPGNIAVVGLYCV